MTVKNAADVYLNADSVAGYCRKGVNIKLAQELTGYSIRVFRDNEASRRIDIDLDDLATKSNMILIN